jgi:hypothetical protein
MQSRVRSLVQGKTMNKNECYSVVWVELSLGKMANIRREDFATYDEADLFASQVMDIGGRTGKLLCLEIVDMEDVTIFEREF